METVIGLIIFGVIWFLIVKLPDIRYNNYTPPKGYKIDYGESLKDMTLNNLSKEEVKRNTVNGKYNVKK